MPWNVLLRAFARKALQTSWLSSQATNAFICFLQIVCVEFLPEHRDREIVVVDTGLLAHPVQPVHHLGITMGMDKVARLVAKCHPKAHALAFVPHGVAEDFVPVEFYAGSLAQKAL